MVQLYSSKCLKYELYKYCGKSPFWFKALPVIFPFLFYKIVLSHEKNITLPDKHALMKSLEHFPITCNF